MANMSPNKLPAREQAPCERVKNFKEVSMGYDADMAMEEATRCLKTVSISHAFPAALSTYAFRNLLHMLLRASLWEAYEVIRSTNSLPAICGRVCPQESQCESKCVRGIKGEPVGIGRLERFVADYAMKNGAKACGLQNLPIKSASP